MSLLQFFNFVNRYGLFVRFGLYLMGYMNKSSKKIAKLIAMSYLTGDCAKRRHYRSKEDFKRAWVRFAALGRAPAANLPPSYIPSMFPKVKGALKNSFFAPIFSKQERLHLALQSEKEHINQGRSGNLIAIIDFGMQRAVLHNDPFKLPLQARQAKYQLRQ